MPEKREEVLEEAIGFFKQGRRDYGTDFVGIILRGNQNLVLSFATKLYKLLNGGSGFQVEHRDLLFGKGKIPLRTFQDYVAEHSEKCLVIYDPYKRLDLGKHGGYELLLDKLRFD